MFNCHQSSPELMIHERLGKIDKWIKNKKSTKQVRNQL